MLLRRQIRNANTRAPAPTQVEEVPVTKRRHSKCSVNLVLVRVVVRDAHGKIVPNSGKADFQYTYRKVATNFFLSRGGRPRLRTLQRWHPLLQRSSSGMGAGRQSRFCHAIWLHGFDALHLSWRTLCSFAIRRRDSLKDCRTSDRVSAQHHLPVSWTQGRSPRIMTNSRKRCWESRRSPTGAGFHDCPT